MNFWAWKLLELIVLNLTCVAMILNFIQEIQENITTTTLILLLTFTLKTNLMQVCLSSWHFYPQQPTASRCWKGLLCCILWLPQSHQYCSWEASCTQLDSTRDPIDYWLSNLENPTSCGRGGDIYNTSSAHLLSSSVFHNVYLDSLLLALCMLSVYPLLFKCNK